VTEDRQTDNGTEKCAGIGGISYERFRLMMMKLVQQRLCARLSTATPHYGLWSPVRPSESKKKCVENKIGVMHHFQFCIIK